MTGRRATVTGTRRPWTRVEPAPAAIDTAIEGKSGRMATRRSRQGDARPSARRHVGLTVPRRVKTELLASADALDWSAGDWVLAAAAEHGPALRRELEGVEVRKRPSVEDATFTALYLTPDERDELDEVAVACGVNRSAFVTAVTRLALGEELAVVLAALRVGAPRPDPSASADPGTLPD